jgi:hypothetical protein
VHPAVDAPVQGVLGTPVRCFLILARQAPHYAYSDTT